MSLKKTDFYGVSKTKNGYKLIIPGCKYTEEVPFSFSVVAPPI